MQGGVGIRVCEGIIITLPAKSFGGGGFCACKLQKLARIALSAWLKAWRIIIIMLSAFNINDLRYDRSAWLCIAQHVVPEPRQNVHPDQLVRFNLDQLVRFHYSRARLRGGASLCCASPFLHLIAFYACSLYISMLSIRYQHKKT